MRCEFRSYTVGNSYEMTLSLDADDQPKVHGDCSFVWHDDGEDDWSLFIGEPRFAASDGRLKFDDDRRFRALIIPRVIDPREEPRVADIEAAVRVVFESAVDSFSVPHCEGPIKTE